MTGFLILKVTASVVTNYVQYLPPDFRSDFLTDRESYFWGAYAWAFYTHIISGPLTLLVGLLLINPMFLQTFPKWHRFLGRVQVLTILCVLTPSGLWMSRHAASGRIAGVGFACLAAATAIFAAMGWRRAVQRRFQEHRRWMWRTFILLCSAVVLRLTAGFTIIIGAERDWVYPLSAWASWLIPLAVFETIELARKYGLIGKFFG